MNAARETRHLRICPYCEATCGLEVRMRGERVLSVGGDPQDVLSGGYVCPKGVAMKAFHEDPDRLRAPRLRRDGVLVEAGWDEAFEAVERGLLPILERDGRDAVALFIGNAAAHSLSLSLYNGALAGALGTRNFTSAGTTDQMPKQVAVACMFGTAVSIPIPDLDRTQHLWILGANPLESNGSLLTAPGIGRRLKAIRRRGGRIVVFDPRRTRTAEAADEHVMLRPGSDAAFLLAAIHVLFAEGRLRLGALEPHVNGLGELEALTRELSPEWAEPRCGIAAGEIRRLARELALAPCAAVYGRIGTCTQAFGVLASWAVDVLNALTGNLDRPGGALFTLPATGSIHTAGRPGRGRGPVFGRWRTRVRGFPEVFREIPNACLAEEMETPGPGRVRGFITVGGNPVLSTPGGDRLDRALAGLEFMVSCDVYVNETTRHAHVILPGLSPLEQPHYDVLLSQFAVRNTARFSPSVLPRPEGALQEWEIMLRLGGILAGAGRDADLDSLDELFLRRRIAMAAKDPEGIVGRLGADAVVEALGARRGPERLVDFLLRSGPWGDRFGEKEDGLSLDRLLEHPHGIDLGPLAPRIPEVLRTPSGKIELAPETVVADLPRLRALAPASPDGLVLVGRRDLRSKNSWMHNLAPLVTGRERCTLQMSPADAARLGLADGAPARVTSKDGAVVAPVEVTDAIAPGVVSLPHGFGHDLPGIEIHVARTHAGVNSNVLAPRDVLEPLSGNAILNGIPVEVGPA